VRVTLLRSDLDELADVGASAQEAFDRGVDALGHRPTHDRFTEAGSTEASVDEAIHLLAETAADMQLIRFALSTEAPVYERSAERYDAVDDRILRLQRTVVPALRAELRRLRARERELELTLTARGIDPDGVGPHVDEANAVDPTPRPWEGERQPRTLSPPVPRPSLRRRVADRVGHFFR